MSFSTKLIDLLKTDSRFVDDDGELVLAAVQDCAWKINRSLVKLLLSDPEIKATFFEEIERHWIFDVNHFIDYISQKNFLDNSYTRFKNRIGLTIGGKFLRERGEVSLVWPYKDCVLEGGQTKEEEKRKEIFFNEVLAQDEISRLLDPKVLTNFVHYSSKGKEKVTDFKRDEKGVIRENLIIKGNNLLALHTLKTQFREQVKLIYIDPPYNTGNDSFGYNDSFNHSTWLTFMKNRLEIAKELLRQDGSIWINIDDEEAHYLKILCDDVFGRENFIANIIWQKKYTIANDARFFSDNHDHIFVFAKSKLNFQVNGLPRTETQEARYSNPDNDPRGPWMTQPLHAKSGTTKGFKYTFKNGVEWEPPRGTYPRYTKESLNKFEEEGLIWFGVNGNAVPRVKKYLSDMSSVTPATLWIHTEAGNNDNARREVLDLIEESEFSTPKPEKLLQRILQIGSNDSDIVLDFVAGSATTGAVSLKMNRQFVLIEQMYYSESITTERIKKVISGEQGGISKSVNWQGGGDFIYCELMKYNEAFMERIQAANSSNKLLTIWQDMAENSFLNWYVNPALPEEAVNDFIALGIEPNGLEKQKHLLAELLDKNQLYVNLSEIDDAQFKVSDEDKRLNKAFYEE